MKELILEKFASQQRQLDRIEGNQDRATKSQILTVRWLIAMFASSLTLSSTILYRIWH